MCVLREDSAGDHLGKRVRRFEDVVMEVEPEKFVVRELSLVSITRSDMSKSLVEVCRVEIPSIIINRIRERIVVAESLLQLW
jgi:hypothetical protein